MVSFSTILSSGSIWQLGLTHTTRTAANQRLCSQLVSGCLRARIATDYRQGQQIVTIPDYRRARLGGRNVLLDRLSRATASYRVSGAISAPFGHATVPPSMKNRRKYEASLRGWKIGPSNH